MRVFLHLSICTLMVVSLCTISCRKPPCETCKGNNKPPVAYAGADQNLILPKDSVVLDGSASSDPDGHITQYKWAKVTGPASSVFADASASKTTVKSLVAGVYRFELTVTDDDGLSSKDTVQVIVDAGNPVACAGPDQTVFVPTDRVMLDGTCSADPNNNIQNYLWTKISGPSSFSIVNANSAQTQVLNLVEGSYQFQLKVTNAGGLFSLDTVQVFVVTSNVAVDVYIAGVENGVAKYWKNGQAVSLSSLWYAYANSIVVVGNDVYVAGTEVGYMGGPTMAKYWKNGQEVFLGGNNSSANSIAVVGSDVYVAGSENNIAKYWKNGQAVSLGSGEATSILIAGNDVYVTGTDYAEAKLWKNGQLVPLSNGWIAEDVAVAGNNVYVAGCESPEMGFWPDSWIGAKYWKNGHAVDLYNGHQSSAQSIFIDSNDVYLSGYGNQKAVYWKNSQAVYLSPNGLHHGSACSISVYKGNVYAAGYEEFSNGTRVAKYWKNGQAVSLTTSGSSSANSIFIVPR